MKVYLVRHGDAKQKFEDPARSLSDKGVEEVNKLGKYISSNLDVRPEIVINSGKARAKQTAEILAEYIGYNEDIEVDQELEPTADPSIWADKLKGMDGDIMLVGHLPYMSRIASLLMHGDDYKEELIFNSATMMCLKLADGSDWILAWSLDPGKLNC